MRKDYIHRQFWKYVLPSMFTMLLSGFYAIVDGLFVGNASGNDALAAINLVWPIQALLNASAIGIGVGGAVVMSVYRGKGEEDSANQANGQTMMLLLVSGILVPAILLLFLPQLLNFLGAEGTLYDASKEYIVIALAGGILPVLGNGLNPLLRNHGKTVVATLCMCSGLITNVLLDYYFVFVLQKGLAGAALATIIAQGIVSVCSFIYLWKEHRGLFQKRYFIPCKHIIKQMLLIGISPFGQTFVPSIVIILTNWKCIEYGGNSAVTIFSVVSYVLSTVLMMLQGIGDGVQPLLSFYYGSKKDHEVQLLYRKAFLLSLAVSLFFMLSVMLLKQPLTILFGVEESIRIRCADALWITAWAFPFLGIAKLTSAYFYAISKNRNSSFLVYMEPCVLLPAFLLVLSMLFQLSGVWAAYPFAQACLCLIALIMKRPILHKQNICILQESSDISS